MHDVGVYIYKKNYKERKSGLLYITWQSIVVIVVAQQR